MGVVDQSGVTIENIDHDLTNGGTTGNPHADSASNNDVEEGGGIMERELDPDQSVVIGSGQSATAFDYYDTGEGELTVRGDFLIKDTN